MYCRSVYLGSSSLAFCCNCCMSIILLFQTHLNFAREFTQAVEMKQVAQQEAERARYLVEKVSKLVNKTDLFINLFSHRTCFYDIFHKYYEFLKGTTQLKLYVCCIVFSLTLKLTSNGR